MVVAISPDTWRRHARFKAKEALPYLVLSDADAKGKLEHEWRGAPHAGHAVEVADWLEAAGDGAKRR